MGRKPFISKENSTKYDLVFRPSEGAAAAPERELIQKDRGVGIGKPDLEQWIQQKQEQQAKQRYPEGHPLAWLQAEEQVQLSEERRKEIVSLGFPDDGYDYLKHVRQGHAETAARNEQGQDHDQEGGPSVFVPAPSFQAPPDDYKAIDASRLTVHQAAERDEDASLVGQGARVFARELNNVCKRYQAEIDEMENLVKQMEGTEEGEGELLEDFVLSATEAKEHFEAELKDPTEMMRNTEQDELAEDTEIDSDSDASSSGQYEPDVAPSESKSYATTYWRPERTDRNPQLSVIDERFEQLALEYDSDDIGELDQLADDQATRGHASTDQYSKMFDAFLDEHATKDHQFEGGQQYVIHKTEGAAQSSEAQDDAFLARNALEMAKEHVRRLQQQEAEPSDPVEQNPYSDNENGGGGARDKWDCESVLTSRSTLYNHPQKLDGGHPRRQMTSPIQLSHRTGLPRLRQEGRHEAAEKVSSKLPPPRKHDESTEEKRARKAAIKDAKRDARTQKTEMKRLFKEEAIKQRRQSTHMPVSISSLS